MSRHRVKAVAMDDDDYYEDNDYGDEETAGEGGDELSEHDRQQLRLGTIEVRKQLGSEYNPSDSEIQEALWHYYYDIGKSVAYLKSQRFPYIDCQTRILTMYQIKLNQHPRRSRR